MTLRVRYFAAAADAAGVDEEERVETTLDALRSAVVTAHPALAAILPRCSVLVDGVRTTGDAPLDDVALVDVLPPFAGG